MAAVLETRNGDNDGLGTLQLMSAAADLLASEP